MSSSKGIYGIRTNGLNHGDVFTSPCVIRFMLDSIGYTSDTDLSDTYIMEPSFGLGDFLIEIQQRIIESSRRFGFNPTETFQKRVFACEVDYDKFLTAINRLQLLMPSFVPINFKNEDFLFTDWGKRFDCVVGNPPYIRYENIPKAVRNIYKQKFSTFHYRCDMYVLFYEHSLNMLADGGKHCFISPNRWLKNEYGKKLRAHIVESFNLEKLIDVEDLDAFQEKVLAYPIISLITNTPNKHMVRTAKIDNPASLCNTIKYESRGYSSVADFDGVFLESRFPDMPTIEEQKFSIGIGVATGADRIFISNDSPTKFESELAIPIINAKDLSGDHFRWGGHYLLNPYDNHGRLIDLNDYPKAKDYLGQHKEALLNRHIVRNKRAWYALIDKIKPDLTKCPKILLPDISANTRIFIDKGRFYPAHNIYYITSQTQSIESLLILAALLMSDFVRKQVSDLSTKMSGGFPRWQSQVLKKLRIPDIDKIPPVYKNQLVCAYRAFNITDINHTVEQIIKAPRVLHERRVAKQLSLFDFSYNI